MKISRRKHKLKKIGLPPGSIVHVGDRKVEQQEISLISFNADEHIEVKPALTDLRSKLPDHRTSWLNITGLHDTEGINNVTAQFNIHPLVVEDILNTEQRAKIEYYDEYIFIALKLFVYEADQMHVRKDQISIILTKNTILTFQELPETLFDPLRKRISGSSSRIRKNSADYLLYAILDIIIDHYDIVLEELQDEMNVLEEAVLTNDSDTLLQQLHRARSELIDFRRSMWPVREILQSLIRDEHPYLSEYSAIFYRDVNDHIQQVSDSFQSLRDRITGLMDLYLTMTSTRMNEVMKVLTVIATIFIPLSFFAGVYGMNFEFFPELSFKWAYPAFWTVAIVVALLMLNFFRRKKWL